MADLFSIYWPGGVGDDPLRDGLSYRPVENGQFVRTLSGGGRGGPASSALSIHMVATFPMSDYQLWGVWWPWWTAFPADGGPMNGTVPFWLRDPFGARLPYRWRRFDNEPIEPFRDGKGWLVRLSLERLPQ